MDSQIAEVAPTVLKRWPLEVGFQIKDMKVFLELVDFSPRTSDKTRSWGEI